MKSINSLLSTSSTSTNSAPFLFPSTPPGHRGRRLPVIVTVVWSRSSREAADNNNYYASGKVVDESMIVLRKRIHEIKIAEQSHNPAAGWLDWEKRYYSDYDSYICEALGYLQTPAQESPWECSSLLLSAFCSPPPSFSTASSTLPPLFSRLSLPPNTQLYAHARPYLKV